MPQTFKQLWEITRHLYQIAHYLLTQNYNPSALSTNETYKYSYLTLVGTCCTDHPFNQMYTQPD